MNGEQGGFLDLPCRRYTHTPGRHSIRAERERQAREKGAMGLGLGTPTPATAASVATLATRRRRGGEQSRRGKTEAATQQWEEPSPTEPTQIEP